MKTGLIAYFIPCVLLLVLLGILLFVALPRSYQKQFGEKYDFKRSFPFEMLYAKNEYLPFGRAIIVSNFVIGFIASAFFLASTSLYPSFVSMAIVCFIAGAVSSLLGMATTLIRADIQIKAHVLAFSLFGVTSVAFDAMNLIAYFHMVDILPALAYIFIGLTIALGLAKLILMLNPKLSNWSRLESSVDEQGVVTHSRPKVFVIAFTEWMLQFGQWLSLLTSLIAFFVFAMMLL